MAKGVDLVTYLTGAASGLLFPVVSDWLRRTILDQRRLVVRLAWGHNQMLSGGPEALLLRAVNDRSTPVALETVEVETRQPGVSGRRHTQRRSADYFVSTHDSYPRRIEQAESFSLALDKRHLQGYGDGREFEVRVMLSDTLGKTWRSNWVVVDPQ